MRGMQLALAVLLGAMASGCVNVERSRDLGNPTISAAVTAAQVCSNCHGIDGNSISPNFPKLAGQQQEYLVNQLKAFRSHQRSDPAGFEYMWGISHNLTDDQITGLADYFSQQTPRRSPATVVDAKLLATGKDIFEKGVPEQNVIQCMACHGPNAQGIGAFPRLAYQHADYIVKQLNVFQNTQGRPGTPMEQITHPLTGENKEAIAAYLHAFPD
ncbi:MAG: c-type cytochrome [Burkholderiales bacterium]